MAASIFAKIISGEVPAHTVYEDDKTIAFLDIFPVQRGHVLVVPKLQVDKFYDLADEDYRALFSTVKKVAKHMEVVLGKRVTEKIEGFDVPHAHVHLIPASSGAEFFARKPIEPASDRALAEVAALLRM